MLVFTNRELARKTTPSAFTTRYRPAAETLGFAQLSKSGCDSWQVGDLHVDASEADAIVALMDIFAGSRPVLVYLHGNNNTPASCFERCALFDAIFDVEVVGFSWPSEGCLPDGSLGVGTTLESVGDQDNLAFVIPQNRTSGGIQDIVRRYHQSQVNARNSIDALARFLRLVGAACLDAGHQPYSLAVHSLGNFFLQNTLAIAGVDESLGEATNVALLAPCADAAGHRQWLGKIACAGQVFVTFNTADTVLAGARIADNGQPKLGAGPGTDLLETPSTRYIDFTGSSTDLLGHNYFVNGAMTGQKKKVLKRIFSSQRDIQGREIARDIYPVGCDERQLTCLMAVPRGMTEADGGG
ncbi:MAG: alpha/beta hydrolase [Caldimonas sp.]